MAKVTFDAADLVPVLIEALCTPQVQARLRETLGIELPPDQPLYMTVTQYAHRREVCPRTVRNWQRDGLPTERRGRVVRIPVGEADAWLAERNSDQHIIELARRNAALASVCLDVDREPEHHDPIAHRRTR